MSKCTRKWINNWSREEYTKENVACSYSIRCLVFYPWLPTTTKRSEKWASAKREKVRAKERVKEIDREQPLNALPTHPDKLASKGKHNTRPSQKNQYHLTCKCHFCRGRASHGPPCFQKPVSFHQWPSRSPATQPARPTILQKSKNLFLFFHFQKVKFFFPSKTRLG